MRTEKYLDYPIRTRVRIVQEYIIYFIWQVVYEIACYIYNLLFQKKLSGNLLPIEMVIYIKLTYN